jgi:hypothetical protein
MQTIRFAFSNPMDPQLHDVVSHLLRAGYAFQAMASGPGYTLDVVDYDRSQILADIAFRYGGAILCHEPSYA